MTPSTHDERLLAIVRAVVHVDVSLRQFRGRPYKLWSDFDDAEIGRWVEWVSRVVCGAALPTDETVLVGVARTVAAELGLSSRPAGINLDSIKRAVARRTGLGVAQLDGRGRTTHVARARHIAMFVAKKVGFSYPAIGRAFGNRDHTTVMSGVRKIEEDRASDPALKDDLRAVLALLDLNLELDASAGEEVADA